MLVTVALCTWNRADVLADTLRGLCAVRIPQDVSWEVIVVTNNCTDNTPAVLQEFASRLPLRVENEPVQGLCPARNRALDAAKGDLLLWIDDDVIVDSEWIAAFVDAARRWPNATFFGGRISPRFAVPKPRWYEASHPLLRCMHAECDWGPEERLFVAEECPIGPNMAFRRTAYQSVRFDPYLGLRGRGNTIRGEENQYVSDLRRQGHVGAWVPRAKVEHLIQKYQMSLRYLWRFCEGQGRWHSRHDDLGADNGVRLFGAPRWLYRLYLGQRVKLLFQRLTGNRQWFETFTSAAQLHGRIIEHRNFYKATQPARDRRDAAREPLVQESWN